jgi:hypothetical protein
MDNLTDVYNQFASIDDELEKQAFEMVKQAEEEEFAGRIMARGFADELNKLAAPSFDTASPIKDMGKGTTIKSKGYAAAGGGGGGKHNISGGADNIAVNMSRKSQGPVQKGMPVEGQVARKKIGANVGGKAISQGKQFKNMQAGGNAAPGAAPGAKPAVAAAPKPAAPLGSVTGKLNLGANMPKLPGAGAKPTMVAGTK